MPLRHLATSHYVPSLSSAGDHGFPGSSGPRGDPGFKGEKGDIGLPGKPGSMDELRMDSMKGQKGEQGEKGNLEEGFNTGDRTTCLISCLVLHTKYQTNLFLLHCPILSRHGSSLFVCVCVCVYRTSWTKW